jgi:site-specific recombinase XerD
MRRALDVIAQIVTGDGEATAATVCWHRLRDRHTAAVREQLTDAYAGTTVNKMLSALRRTLKEAWRLGQMAAEDYQKAAAVENLPGARPPAGRQIASGELRRLLDVCGHSPGGIRDAAIISLLYAGGLRRAELVDLDLADLDAVAGTLRVRGQGSQERVIHVVGGAAAALEDWLEVRNLEAGPLFWGLGNRNRGGRLTTQAIYYMLQKRAEMAGVDALSPHDFRRTFVSDLLEQGADIATVQKLAGHAHLQTTAAYHPRREQARREAAEMLHVPHTRRKLPETDKSKR